jgi:hypothetical protein
MTSAPVATPPRQSPARPAPQPASNGASRSVASTSIGIRKAGKMEPPRIVLNAVEGWGKSTFGAYAPTPIFLMARGETGVDTLKSAGRIPDVDTFDVCQTWEQALRSLKHLLENDTGHGAVVLDALGGFERLCHEHVCQTQFHGDWGEKGFSSFQKGYELSIPEWQRLLVALDSLRSTRGMTVVLLSHCKVRPFKNPLGSDFDRYVADCHDKTWGITHKWADVVLFGNFITVIKEEKKGRPKGIGGSDRIIYSEHSDAFDAKNRYGMPAEVEIPNDPAQVWSTVAQHIVTKGAK